MTEKKKENERKIKKIKEKMTENDKMTKKETTHFFFFKKKILFKKLKNVEKTGK